MKADCTGGSPTGGRDPRRHSPSINNIGSSTSTCSVRPREIKRPATATSAGTMCIQGRDGDGGRSTCVRRRAPSPTAGDRKKRRSGRVSKPPATKETVAALCMGRHVADAFRSRAGFKFFDAGGREGQVDYNRARLFSRISRHSRICARRFPERYGLRVRKCC